MTAAHTAEVGRMERPMVTVYVLDQKARENTPAPGNMGTKSPEYTLGLVVTNSRVSGYKERDTD
jgi:hypothetical protein